MNLTNLLKKCSHCKEEKTLDNFYKQGRDRQDYQTTCRSCKIILQKVYKERHRKDPVYRQKTSEYMKAYRRRIRYERPGHTERQEKDSQLRIRYGITLTIYNDLFNKQSGLCLGCYKHASEFKQALAVDHDHTTKKIRGLLCINCNRSLGYAKDKSSTLRRLADYLDRNFNA
jgi:hypothetical protein